jgi:Na+-transporting methylmalonyl-CoA/oxaloacetate decarboxylase gamma subunit
LNGLNAISAHNGWNITIVGISIVFTGLTLLSFSIAQLHKVLKLWEEKHDYYKTIKELFQKKEKPLEDMPELTVSHDFKESAHQFYLLIETMGKPFPLPRLLKLAERCGLSQSHSTLNKLLEAKLIIPDNEGFFNWDQGVYEKIKARSRG